MATKKQKALAVNLIDPEIRKRFKYLRDLLVYSGYSWGSARSNPMAIISQKGVQNHLIKIGFTEDTAKATVGEILLSGKEENRIKAAQEVFKIFGTYAPEKIHSDSFIYQILKEVQNGESKPIITENNSNTGNKEKTGGQILEVKQFILDKE